MSCCSSATGSGHMISIQSKDRSMWIARLQIQTRYPHPIIRICSRPFPLDRMESVIELQFHGPFFETFDFIWSNPETTLFGRSLDCQKLRLSKKVDRSSKVSCILWIRVGQKAHLLINFSEFFEWWVTFDKSVDFLSTHHLPELKFPLAQISPTVLLIGLQSRVLSFKVWVGFFNLWLSRTQIYRVFHRVLASRDGEWKSQNF
jgi:hypothetical protein